MIALLILASLALVPVGPGSGSLFLADANGDGHLDLITQHLLQKRIQVSLGDGRGRFTASVPIELNFQPGPIAVGDLNNDRVLDLAMATRHDDREAVDVLLGDGKGGFGPPVSFRTNSREKLYKAILRLADIDEDGALDIITTNGRRNSIEILLGNGRGQFSPTTSVTMESDGSLYSFEIGDMDGDRHLDLVTASDAGSLFIHRGDGRGRFANGVRVPVRLQADPRVAAVGDVNDDRLPDIVLTHGRSGIVSMILSQGGNRFTSRQIKLGQPAWGVLITDANGDGRADLIATTVNQNRPFGSRIVARLGGKSESSFQAGPGAYHLAAGDVDEDGKLDFAASSFEGDAVTLLLGSPLPAR